MALNLKDAHREKLVQILIDQALISPATPQQFFIDLVKTANPKLSTPFLIQAIAIPKGNNPGADARAIVDWADNKGIYPQDSRYTVLGILLAPLLPSLGLEDASFIVALIFHYQLFREPSLLEPFTAAYQVPLLATSSPGAVPPTGPDFLWDDPRDYSELQTLIQQRQVTFLDVGFLQQAIQQATAVCRIELPDAQDATKRRFIGTGFLVAPDLVITNYHVLAPEKDSDIKAYVNRVELNFGRFSTPDKLAALTQIIQLIEQPIIKASHTDALDYVLLKMEHTAENLQPAPLNPNYPAVDTGLNILQHPDGAVMKLALSPNGITRVLKDKGLLHYISDTAGGSSGSPCYDDDWRVVALHHAEKSGPAWVYREGILMREIYQEIEVCLG